MPKTHFVTLSNGTKVFLEEGKDQLSIGEGDPAIDAWFVCAITCDGVIVYPNSCNGPSNIAEGLSDRDAEEETPE